MDVNMRLDSRILIEDTQARPSSSGNAGKRVTSVEPQTRQNVRT
jgi:hypothetical protein